MCIYAYLAKIILKYFNHRTENKTISTKKLLDRAGKGGRVVIKTHTVPIVFFRVT